LLDFVVPITIEYHHTIKEFIGNASMPESAMKPMRSFRQAMSWKEFENFPRRLGWKHEYYDGTIHLTPAWTAVTTLRLTLATFRATPSETCRPIRKTDREPLAELFQASFLHAMEYVDYPIHSYRKSSRDAILSFFNEANEPFAHASCLVEEDNRIVAAALIQRCKKGPILQPIFVHPNHQRKGLATTLTNQAVSSLPSFGEPHLYSRCHLGNAGSYAWHLRFGFEELPNFFVAGHCRSHYAAEYERHRRLKDLDKGELTRLRDQRDYWNERCERLDNLEIDAKYENTAL
jgi:L-amino acid N-acyltransferase YncA